MISKIIPILLIIIFSVYVNNGLFSYLLFKCNQEEIVSDCCEKIVINCEGKCYLLKSIEKNDKEASEKRENLKESVNPVLYCHKVKSNLRNTNRPIPLFQYYAMQTSEGYFFLEDNPPKI
ncbi:MAG: hypothetical protein IPL53_16030 [Ignavibacteria bacterium]|nr:hypothetical protein [Ignavibacteria bacterium]